MVHQVLPVQMNTHDAGAFAVWTSLELRDEWEQAISPKLVGFFERFARASDPLGFKTKGQHHQDTGIPLKFIDRSSDSLVDFLEQVGLIKLERSGNLFRVTPVLPVISPPPREVRLPLSPASNGGGVRPSTGRRSTVWMAGSAHIVR